MDHVSGEGVVFVTEYLDDLEPLEGDETWHKAGEQTARYVV